MFILIRCGTGALFFVLFFIIARDACVNKIFRNSNPKLLSWIGKNSLYFFVLHWPVFYLVKNIYCRIIFVNMSEPQGYTYLLSLQLVSFAVCLSMIKITGLKRLLFRHIKKTVN